METGLQTGERLQGMQAESPPTALFTSSSVESVSDSVVRTS